MIFVLSLAFTLSSPRTTFAADVPCGFVDELIYNQFAIPLGITFLPDGRALAWDKLGTIDIFDPNNDPINNATTYMIIPGNKINSSGESGLLDLTLDPDFSLVEPLPPGKNRYFYVYYMHDIEAPATTELARISRFEHDVTTSTGDLSSETVIFTNTDPENEPLIRNSVQNHFNHAGCGLDFAPDGTLVITIGDSDATDGTLAHSQRNDLYAGKVLRINKDGTIPADNPFEDPNDGILDEIFAFGLRNPFRARFDDPTGRLLIGEVGGNTQSVAVEEINLAIITGVNNTAGANYGWPDCEGIICNPPLMPHEIPIHSVNHFGNQASITGGVVYRGSTFPTTYSGVYFYGDFVRSWLRYLTFDPMDNTVVTGDFEFSPNIGSAIGIEQSPTGDLYYMVLGATSQIRRIRFNNVPEPTVAITSPANGAVFIENNSISFTGTACDLIDGDVTSSLDWVSDQVVGSIGTGGTFSRSDLPVGTHVITATVSDNEMPPNTGSAQITITINPPNTPPMVSIDMPLEGEMLLPGETITFMGTASDTEDGDLTASLDWTSDIGGMSIGMGGMFTRDDLTFGNHIITTTVTDSGGLSDSDQIMISIPPPSTETLDVRVAAGSDDAEERDTGFVSLTSTDLEFTRDDNMAIGEQTIGMVFNSISVPPGSTIVDAYIQFQTDETGTEATTVFIQGEASDNAATFTSATNNITSRQRTASTVQWDPVSWTVVGEADLAQRTPNLSPIIQEIIDRAGWADGNSLAMIIDGTGKRTAESFNGVSSAAPLLHLEYVLPNMPPMVTIQAPTTGSEFTQGDTITFTGTASDDEDGDLTASIEWFSDLVVGSIGTGGTFNRNDLLPGLHSITAMVTDSGGKSASQQVTITIFSPSVETLEVRISMQSDDAEEELSSGAMNLTSTDLELARDDLFGPNDQAVGMRFNGINIPQGASIVNGYIQFQTDEVGSEATSLLIHGEDSDNAGTFTTAINNITLRPRTGASVSWNPNPWTVVGEAGPDQQTPDIAAIIKEIIDRPGWTSGNSLAIFIDGSGKRTAESRRIPQAAPLLHIEYSITNAAPELTVTLPTDGATFNEGDTITFSGTATDDEDGDLTAVIDWLSDQVSGSIGTGGMFTRNDLPPGPHIITTTVTDTGGLSVSETRTINIIAAGTQVLDVRVEANSDNAEEKLSSGAVSTTSSDLELIRDGSLDQMVGMRFNLIDIPQGANIANAYVQFRTDEIGTEATSLMIKGEASDDPETFVQTTNNITLRPSTSASVDWNPSPWLTIGEAGPAQRTPNIAAVIQEIVNRPGWSSGNSLVLLIQGAGRRTADSHKGASSFAPLLHVEYDVSNMPPTVLIQSIEEGSIFTEGTTITFAGIANDEEDGPLTTNLDWSSDLFGPLGTGGFFTRDDLPVGLHTISATVTDSGGLVTSDHRTLTILAPNVQALDIRVDAGLRRWGGKRFRRGLSNQFRS